MIHTPTPAEVDRFSNHGVARIRLGNEGLCFPSPLTEGIERIVSLLPLQETDTAAYAWINSGKSPRALLLAQASLVETMDGVPARALELDSNVEGIRVYTSYEKNRHGNGGGHTYSITELLYLPK